MKFLLSRTSDGYEARPSVKSEKFSSRITTENKIWIDIRTVETLAEAETREWFRHWKEKTVNHREITLRNGSKCIGGDDKNVSELHLIELHNIEELLEFIDSEGHVVISPSDRFVDGPEFEIEIYDDYRE